MFHDPHSCERSFRVYPKNFDRRISKNYLVRREMACRERTRPPALPRRPKASAVSLPPICEFHLGDNLCSNFITSFKRTISVDASSPSIQLLNGSASRNAKLQ